MGIEVGRLLALFGLALECGVHLGLRTFSLHLLLQLHFDHMRGHIDDIDL